MATGNLDVEITMVVNWMSVNDAASLPASAFAPMAEPGQRTFIDGVEQP